MRRREFIALLGGAAATWPLSARAQQPDRVKRVGVLMAYAESDLEAVARVKAFTQALEGRGWTDGRNVQIEYRWASGDRERFRAYAVELVGLQPNVILSATTPVLGTLLRETRTIPIVFLSVSDPVGDGFIASLARPGGNATGFINIESSMAGKWVELLKEISPNMTRATAIFNPKTTAGGGAYFLQPFEAAARSLAVEPIFAPVQDTAELESAVAALAADPGGALVVLPDGFNVNHRKLIISLAARHRVPTIYPYRYMVTEGGLTSYGIDLLDMYQRAAEHVDRILKGEKPADIPVQAPAKFEFAINLKTAKSLGLTIQPTLLTRADEVIE